MAKLNAARQAQYPLMAEFTFEVANDTMTDVAGAAKDFKTVGSTVFEVIPLPINAVVVGGDVVTETAVTGSTLYNVSVGDSASATRYLGATDRTAAGRTALVPTGYRGAGENIRITIAPTVAASTGGKVTVRVLYTIKDRGQEVVVV